ncbi:MAG TPA: hypothetical protein VH476_08885 [Solirubrobacterales bacterium]
MVIALAVLVSALVFAEPSPGLKILKGPLVVTWSPEVAPQRRPRSKAVTATLRLAFKSKSRESAETPQLSGFGIEMIREVVINPTGLRPCRRGYISPDSPATACDPSLVGHGSITYEIAQPEEPPIRVRGLFRAFYSDEAFFPDEGDHPAIVAVVKARAPAPTTFVIPFTVAKRQGEEGGMRLFIPPGRIPARWSHISAFNISLHRVFVDEKGKRRSFVSATCQPPSGSIVFPHLVGTFTYANGEQLRQVDRSTQCIVAP